MHSNGDTFENIWEGLEDFRTAFLTIIEDFDDGGID